MRFYDELLVGAIDLHCHADLEFSEAELKREPETAWLAKAEGMGLRGAVLKSHWWPTVTAVPLILATASTKVSLWSSVTLNSSAGGPYPCVVEAAAAMGGKVVFLPTWSARNDIERRGFSHRLRSIYQNFARLENPGYVITDDRGELSAAAKELLEMCKARELTLGSGHVSWQESLALAKEAQAMGYKRLILNHPLSDIIGTPLDALKRAAELGAFVETCWHQLAPGRMEPRELVAKLRSIGLGQVVASTDYFRSYSPNPPELFRMFLGMLHEGGLSREEVKRVAVVNPARAMGLE
jgi:hypothetical protein